DVLERSRELPVVVDFWAPWCGPCRIIGPVLEGLAEEYAGRVQLVKLNTDENPRVASQLRIQSIPHVMAFKDGKLAKQFVGAVPEPQARAFFEALVPSGADLEAQRGDEARTAGDLASAITRYEAALALEPEHVRASMGLAEVALAQGEVERAASVLEPVAAYSRDAEVKRLAGRIRLQQAAAGLDRDALARRVAASEDDARAHYDLGAVLVAAGEWEDGLEHLLDAVRLDRSLDGDGPRTRLLDALEVLGADHPLSREFRARLANVLF
ncbi:MAG: thioredoxin, partial [Dehalococcoidia bacterium]|nr:thioredoxin [Dehalococcoidia bacterium]